MKRKVLSLLLCGLIACSMLTACGGSNDSAKTGVEEKNEKVSEKEIVKSDKQVESIKPSIYSELMAGKSTMEDAKKYAINHVMQFEGGAHTDIQEIYGEFIPQVKGNTFLLYRKNKSGNFSSDCIIDELITKVSYSSIEESAQISSAIMDYLDKSYIRGTYNVTYNRPAYIVSDDAESLVFIWIDNQYSDEEGHIITVHETNYRSKPERSCWFDENGKAFIPQYFKAQGVTKTNYNNIEEANIDISSIDIYGMSSGSGANNSSEKKEVPANDASSGR